VGDRVGKVFLPSNLAIPNVLPPDTAISELAKTGCCAAFQKPDELEMRSIPAEDEDAKVVRHQAVGQHPPPGAVHEANRFRHKLTREPVAMKNPPPVSNAEVDQRDHRLLVGLGR